LTPATTPGSASALRATTSIAISSLWLKTFIAVATGIYAQSSMSKPRTWPLTP
jgi:hypothetical protein